LIEAYTYRLSPDARTLISIKDQAIDEKNRDMLREYINARKHGLTLRPGDKDWGQEWVDTCVL
jgi:hypothetical protein